MVRRKRKEYYARINPFIRYTDEKFETRYRLPKQSVIEIANGFARSPFAQSAGTGRSGGISHRERVCLALRFLATGSFYATIGDTQGVHKSTVSRAVRQVVDYLYWRSRDHIKFPKPEEYAESAAKFSVIHGMPLTIGCVDGTHVAIRAPHYEEGAYVNRKGFHSLNVQLVCDADQKIIHIDASKAGCQNDAFVWGRSSLHDAAEAGRFGQFFILGDSGYPLKDYLMTPYLHPEGRGQERYNESHVQTRLIVERTIGILKSVWRCLDDSGGALQSSPIRAARIVVACSVLHNMGITIGMRRDFEDIDEDAPRPLSNRARLRRERRRARLAARMRADIEDYIPNMDEQERGHHRNRRDQLVATKFDV